ncbi:MAG: hypothetical protein IT318_21765 [Anaerolineales bacterium]|nr:hypothetical protein [Anaerolineales bacterium]
MVERLKEALSRINGVSTPAIGLSWNPPEPDRSRATRLVKFLAGRRVLSPYYIDPDMEIVDYAVMSVLKVRDRLSEDLERVRGNSHLGQALEAMHRECMMFLDRMQAAMKHLPPAEGYSEKRKGDRSARLALMQLQRTVVLEVAKLIVIYDIEDVPEDLLQTLEHVSRQPR